MEKRLICKWMMGKMMLICVNCLICVSTSMAQASASDKIEQAKRLFSVKSLALTNEHKQSVIDFFDKCSKSQKEAILNYMIEAITDSLKAENKQFAMNYIDYYKIIADPDNEYLGSLVMTEGKYYYDQMNAPKLLELKNFLNGVAAKSKLDYSIEVSDLTRMRDEVLNGCQDLIGYWIADFSNKNNADPFFINIYRDYKGAYRVITEYSSTVSSYYTDLWQYGDKVTSNYHFCFSEKQEAFECVKTSPKTLSYFWASEKLNVGKEYLTTALRSGVRSVSNSIIGELARSNKYDFGTTILGSTGAVVGEAILNSIIDELSVSKKTIRTITGNLTPIDKNNIDAIIFVDYFKLRSDNSGLNEEHLQFNVRLIRCQWNDSYVRDNIAFADGQIKLRQASPFLKKQRKKFCKSNPEARRMVRRIQWWPYSFVNNRTLRKYNRLQLERVKEYNNNH